MIYYAAAVDNEDTASVAAEVYLVVFTLADGEYLGVAYAVFLAKKSRYSAVLDKRHAGACRGGYRAVGKLGHRAHAVGLQARMRIIIGAVLAARIAYQALFAVSAEPETVLTVGFDTAYANALQQLGKAGGLFPVTAVDHQKSRVCAYVQVAAVKAGRVYYAVVEARRAADIVKLITNYLHYAEAGGNEPPVALVIRHHILNGIVHREHIQSGVAAVSVENAYAAVGAYPELAAVRAHTVDIDVGQYGKRRSVGHIPRETAAHYRGLVGAYPYRIGVVGVGSDTGRETRVELKRMSYFKVFETEAYAVKRAAVYRAVRAAGHLLQVLGLDSRIAQHMQGIFIVDIG